MKFQRESGFQGKPTNLLGLPENCVMSQYPSYYALVGQSGHDKNHRIIPT